MAPTSIDHQSANPSRTFTTAKNHEEDLRSLSKNRIHCHVEKKMKPKHCQINPLLKYLSLKPHL